MTVTSRLLKLAAVFGRSYVIQDTFLRAYRAANALYEVLFDATAPGGSSQVYQGHDHTPEGGGGPIHRGGLWSEMRFNSDDPLFSYTFTAANQVVDYLEGYDRVGSPLRYMTSPGIGAARPLKGWICTRCSGASTFFLRLPDGSEVELPVSSTDRRLWTPFTIYTTDLRAVYDTTALQFRCGGYDAEDAPTVRVWGITLSETDATVENAGARLAEPPVGQSADLVASTFEDLDDALVGSYTWVDPILLHRLYKFGTALFEGTHDWRGVGAASQVCRGHDHYASGYGGRAVARGRQYTAANGKDPLYTLSSLSASYRELDYDDTNGRTDASIGMIRYRPSFTSSGSPPTNPPYLTVLAFVSVSLSALATIDFRMLRTGTGSVSDVNTLSAIASYSGWITIDKVPCAEGSTNDLTLQARVTGSVTGTIEVWAIQLTEEPGVGGRTAPGSKIPLGGV